MVFVGLMGGTSYSNTYYMILTDDKIIQPHKELSQGLSSGYFILDGIFTSLSILASSVISLVLANTLLK
jgi:hypothetical protein